MKYDKLGEDQRGIGWKFPAKLMHDELVKKEVKHHGKMVI